MPFLLNQAEQHKSKADQNAQNGHDCVRGPVRHRDRDHFLPPFFFCVFKNKTNLPKCKFQPCAHAHDDGRHDPEKKKRKKKKN